MSKARHFEKDVESGFKTFLVTFKAVGKGHASDRWIFSHRQQAEFIQEFKDYLTLFPAMKILSYTSMSNHFHYLIKVDYTHKITRAEVKQAYLKVYGQDLHSNSHQIRTLVKDGYNLSKLMHRYLHDTAYRFNKKQNRNKSHHRTGHLWSGRYHSLMVGSTASLLRAARYILVNPVKANITNHPIGWNNNSLHGCDADQLMENLHNCYNLYANERGQLNLDEFKTKLNQILDDAVHELEEAHKKKKKKKEDKEMTFCQEESKMWRQATAIGPPDKLEPYAKQIQECPNSTLTWIH